ncbi:U3 small nucleolar RNA-associated protein 18 homolog isoform 3-T3 [Syngnathus typhle]
MSSKKRSARLSVEAADVPEEEARARRKNIKRLALLRAEEPTVQKLEDIIFGDVQEEEGEEDEKEVEEEGDQSDEETEARLAPPPIKKAAWVDDDDELEEEVDMQHRFRSNLMRGQSEARISKTKLQQRMRDQFQKSMGGAPSWATDGSKKSVKDDEDDDDGEDDEDDDLLRKTGNFVASSDSLPSGIIGLKKCCHANAARLSSDRLTSVQFHPSAQVVLTAGLDCSLSFFQVDGKTNAKIQSVHLDRFPIYKARFTCQGDAVIATSVKNKMFYMYDMMEGRIMPVHQVKGLREPRIKEFCVCPEGGALLLTGTQGYLHMLTLKTKEVVNSIKLNGEVVGVAMSSDGSKVFANSEDGEVFVWDVRSSRCVNRFTDHGCVAAKAIAASADGRYLACGSQAGVVNVYSQQTCLNSANPTPLKAIMNLLTPVTALTFNPSAEILAIASQYQEEAAKLVHVPSLSVFSNFPLAKKKFVYRVSCMDFSPHSGFFSFANNKGRAPLFRLTHYNNF